VKGGTASAATGRSSRHAARGGLRLRHRADGPATSGRPARPGLTPASLLSSPGAMPPPQRCGLPLRSRVCAPFNLRCPLFLKDARFLISPYLLLKTTLHSHSGRAVSPVWRIRSAERREEARMRPQDAGARRFGTGMSRYRRSVRLTSEVKAPRAAWRENQPDRRNSQAARAQHSKMLN